MPKRLRYPSYGEDPAHNALCQLKFYEHSDHGEDAIAPNSNLKTAQRRDSEAITEQLVSAMHNFYSLDYKEWVNKYWHSALKPNLAASIDSAQRESVYKAFEQALREECYENSRLVSGAVHPPSTSSQDFEAGRSPYKISSKFLLYARNFDLRTKRKLQIVFALERKFKSGAHNDGIINFSKKQFGSIVLTDALKSQITEEIVQSLSLNSFSSLGESNLSMSAHEQYRLQVVYPALLAHTLNEFFGSSHVDGLDPLSHTCESLLRTVKANTKLVDSDGKLPYQLFPIAMSDLEYETDISQYAAATVIPMVSGWLARISEWIQFGRRIIEFSQDLSNCSFDADAATLLNDRIQKDLDQNLELSCEVLSIYMIYKVLHGEQAAASKPTAPDNLCVPVSVKFLDKLACKLCEKIVGDESSKEILWSQTPFSRRLLRLSKAVSSSEDFLGAQSSRSLLLTTRRLLADRDIYASIYQDVVQGIVDENAVGELIRAFGLAPDLAGFEQLSAGFNDWEEKQYTALIHSMIISLLPKKLGGSQTDSLAASKAYYLLQRNTGDLFGALPNLITQEASKLNLDVAPLLLNSGIWMCAEDPSLTERTPTVFRGLADDASGLMSYSDEWVKRWHLGWSAIKCKLSIGGCVREFQCSALHFEILQKLISSSLPLDFKELLPQINDDEFVRETVATLTKRSENLVISSKVNGKLKFVLDPTFKAVWFSSLSPAVSDRM